MTFDPIDPKHRSRNPAARLISVGVPLCLALALVGAVLLIALPAPPADVGAGRGATLQRDAGSRPMRAMRVPPYAWEAPARADTVTAPAPAAPAALATMGNPAATYCRDLGYRYGIVGDGGGQRGVCEMPDGEVCDAWGFLQGTCGQRHGYCARRGYEVRTLSDGQDPYSPERAVCVTAEGAVVGSVTELSRLGEKATLCEGGAQLPAALSAASDEVYAPSSTRALPAAFDWRNHQGGNWMTSVKNQGSCGSCWSFAAVGIAEVAHNIAAGDPDLDPDLSEQYLVADCYTGGDCCGGWHAGALTYIRDQGVPDEGCLSYVDGGGCFCDDPCPCTYVCSDRTCADRCGDWESRLESVRSVGLVPSDRATIKAALVEVGPLAVAMGIQSAYGGFWDGDIYRCSDDGGVNHGVIIVGYDDAGGYWWVKNSWGTGWGDGGYFKLGYGECAAEERAYFTNASVAPTVRYVDADATGAATGLSWEDAYTSLQDALDEANAFGNKVYEIWVAEGVYRPDEDGDGDHVGDDPAESFRLRYNNVLLYGGFSGTESAREERDWAVNVTVLSGDIDENDLTDAGGVVTTTTHITGRNAYHVLYVDGGQARVAGARTVVDGFTITAGQADADGYPDDQGGALYLGYHATGNQAPALANLIFSGNAAKYGGALYDPAGVTLTDAAFTGNAALSYGGALYSTGNPTLTHVTFTDNWAQYGGAHYHSGSGATMTDLVYTGNGAKWRAGALYVGNTSSLTLTNGVFIGNRAPRGGAIYNSGDPVLVNVSLSGNTGEWYGGALYNTERPALHNAVLWGNSAPDGAQIYNDAGAACDIGFSDVQGSGGSGAGWDAGLGTDGGGNIDADPQFADGAGGDLHLSGSSPAIDAGDNGALPADVATDLDGNDRRIDIPTVADTGSGSAPIVDMGAYEVQSQPDLRLTKVALPAAANPGDALTYVLTFDNAGAVASADVVITDVVPVSVTVTQVVSDADVPITQTLSGTRTYAWRMVRLDAGQGGAITMTGVLSDVLRAGSFGNTAVITGATAELVTANNTGAADVAVRNVAPVAASDVYTTAEDTTLSVDAPGVLSGAGDANGDALTAVVARDPAAGALTLAGDGGFDYVPRPNANGVVTFTYRAVDDGGLASDPTVVTITIEARNDPPVATDDVYSTYQDAPVHGNVLTDNTGGGLDDDVDGDPLTAVKETDPVTGALTLASDGAFTYTPAPAYTGVVTFTYHVTDVAGLSSNTALVTITVAERPEVYSVFLPLALR